MRKVIGIIIGLAVLAGLAMGGYYLFHISTDVAEDMTIEDVGDVETETVGYSDQPGVSYDPASDDEDLRDLELAKEEYKCGEELFDLMEENDEAFFFVDTSGVPSEEGWPVVVSNKEEFAKATGLASVSNVDTVLGVIGVGVKGFLNQDAEGMKEWDACKKRKGMFPSGTDYDRRQANPGLIFSFDGESPDTYFSDRELSIKCEDISTEKVAVFWDSEPDSLWQVIVIYNAKVRTESCKGESVFPPEGETGDMKIMVGAWYGEKTVTSYDCIYFR